MTTETQQIQNIRHSANSPNWISPPWIVHAGREVMDGVIHLDPASSAQANELAVNALMYFDKTIDGLRTPWSHQLPQPQTLTNVWLNPPGGWEEIQLPTSYKDKKRGVHIISNVAQTINVSRVKLWWQRLLDQRTQDYFAQALFLSFSIESMQTTQIECERSVLDFPTCVFRSRVAYIDPETGKFATGMTHSSAITYIPGRVDRTTNFLRVFAPHGKITLPYTAVAA